MTRPRPVLIGLAMVVLYLVAVPVTGALRHDDARPLYDAFTLPTSYRFVDPPAFFASGNVKPQALATTIALGPRGSQATGFGTPDGQFAVSLAAGAIAPAPSATSVAVRVTPLAPRDLAAVPNGLRANGNVYRVQMTYQPSGKPVARFTHPGTLLLAIPELGTSLFVSTGAAWSAVAARTITTGQLGMSAEFASPGDYLGATSLPELAAPAAHTRHTALVVGIATGIVAVILLAVASYVVARRRRARL